MKMLILSNLKFGSPYFLGLIRNSISTSHYGIKIMWIFTPVLWKFKTLEMAFSKEE